MKREVQQRERDMKGGGGGGRSMGLLLLPQCNVYMFPGLFVLLSACIIAVCVLQALC
jgi:hypothetical protein